jgi:hypothetical protein
LLGLLVRRWGLPESRDAAAETEVEASNDLPTLGSVAGEGRDRVY